jgi:hypothetical protein
LWGGSKGHPLFYTFSIISNNCPVWVFPRLSPSQPRELLSNHIHIRFTDSDYNQIKARAEQVNLSMSDFMRRAALRRRMPRPLAAFNLKAYQVLCKIETQLRIARNNLNQIAKACNSVVALGESVVVNTGLFYQFSKFILQ